MSDADDVHQLFQQLNDTLDAGLAINDTIEHELKSLKSVNKGMRVAIRKVSKTFQDLKAKMAKTNKKVAILNQTLNSGMASLKTALEMQLHAARLTNREANRLLKEARAEIKQQSKDS